MKEFVYHITHIDNLDSILEHRLLPHNTVEYYDINHHEICDEEVMSLNREYYGKNLHRYIRFYLNPRNPMLYRRRNIQNKLILLQVRISNLIDLTGKDSIIITNGNAASSSTGALYYDDFNEDFLNTDCLYGKSWNNFPDGKRERCAELLLSAKSFNILYCSAIYVYNEGVLNKVNAIFAKHNLTKRVFVSDYLYFK